MFWKTKKCHKVWSPQSLCSRCREGQRDSGGTTWGRSLRLLQPLSNHASLLTQFLFLFVFLFPEEYRVVAVLKKKKKRVEKLPLKRQLHNPTLLLWRESRISEIKRLKLFHFSLFDWASVVCHTDWPEQGGLGRDKMLPFQVPNCWWPLSKIVTKAPNCLSWWVVVSGLEQGRLGLLGILN